MSTDQIEKIEIANNLFSNRNTFIIAEVAQAHDGSLGMAHSYIDAVASTGANAIKFQTHIAQAESTIREPWRVKFSQQDVSRYDYWKRMEFTFEQWEGLKRHCDDKGLIFLSSPFSEDAVELLSKIGVAAWKIASGEVSNLPLLRALLRHPLPIIISSGLCTQDDLDTAVNIFKESSLPIAVLQCTTEYPCPPEKIGLNQIELLAKKYEVPVGLSDHSGEVATALAAVTIGISILEVHVTFHKSMFGPDVPASLTIENLCDLVRGVRYIEKILASPVIKAENEESMLRNRKIFGKSIVAVRSLPSGHVIEKQDIAFKKPGDGVPPKDLELVLGRKLKMPISFDELVVLENLD